LHSPFFDFSAFLAYTIDKKRGKKRGERKARKRTNGDKKDRQAATTRTLTTEYKAALPHVLTSRHGNGKGD
jgi:hypothetical protein